MGLILDVGTPKTELQPAEDNNEISNINFNLSEIMKKLPGFGEVKVYFS